VAGFVTALHTLHLLAQTAESHMAGIAQQLSDRALRQPSTATTQQIYRHGGGGFTENGDFSFRSKHLIGLVTLLRNFGHSTLTLSHLHSNCCGTPGIRGERTFPAPGPTFKDTGLHSLVLTHGPQGF
jgi:hypothetical protein